jgi:RHS repeat-associated protein
LLTTPHLVNFSCVDPEDFRRNLDITYNLLNLPYQIKQNDTVKATYKYLADGTKLSAAKDSIVGISTIRDGNISNTVSFGFDYFGSMVYTRNVIDLTLESTSFGGGRINKTTSAYDINYFITDHLGSTRAIVNANGNITGQYNYYPFGKQWENPNLLANTNRWGFSGKEKQTTNDLGLLDFGARMLINSEVPVWTTQDPLAEKYYSISPYVYCMNNPIKSVDFDGRLVIFINGMNFDGRGGTANYWNGFDTKIMEHLKDSNPHYIDGSLGGISGLVLNGNFLSFARKDIGEFEGMLQAPSIVKAITDENGNIKETIKIITHSMGAAYAKGYVKALVAYLKKHNIPIEAIAFEADFAPYQPKKQKAVKGVKTYQFTNFNDNVASNSWLLSPYGYIEGAEVHTNFDENKGHSLSDFWEQVRNLPEGKYRVVNGQIVPY